MSAVVCNHLAALCCIVKSNAVLIGDQVIILSMDNENWTGVGTHHCEVVEWIPDKKAWDKKTQCKRFDARKCGQKNECRRRSLCSE